MAIEKKPSYRNAPVGKPTVVDVPVEAEQEILEVFVKQSLGKLPLSDFDGYGGQSPVEAAFEIAAKHAQNQYGARCISEYNFVLNGHSYDVTVDMKMLDS